MLAEEVETLYTQIQRAGLGDDLQVLKATLFATRLAAIIKELKVTAAPLLIALSATNIGIKRSESQSGLLPDYFVNYCESLAEGLKILMPNGNHGTRRLLALLIAQLSTALILVTTYLSANKKDLLSLDLFLQAIMSGGILVGITEVVGEICGATENTKRQVGVVITLVFLFIMIQVVAARKGNKPEEFVESLARYILPLMQEIDSLAVEKSFSIHWHKARMALEESNYEVFVDTLASFEEESCQNFKQDKPLKAYIDENDASGLHALCIRLNHYLVKGAGESLNEATGIVQG